MITREELHKYDDINVNNAYLQKIVKENNINPDDFRSFTALVTKAMVERCEESSCTALDMLNAVYKSCDQFEHLWGKEVYKLCCITCCVWVGPQLIEQGAIG